MKKKVIMLVLALALVFAMNTATAKAALKDSTNVDWVYVDGDHYTANTLQAGFTDLATVYGVRWTIEVTDLSGGVGGGIIINSETNDWNQKEWGNDGAGKEFTIQATSTENVYTITRIDSAPMFGANDGYANLCLSQWWGPDAVVIKKVEILAKEGSVIFSTTKAVPKEESKEEAAEETPAETEETLEEAEETPEVISTNDSVPKTGVASATAVYALGSLLSAAGIVVAKKRNR